MTGWSCTDGAWNSDGRATGGGLIFSPPIFVIFSFFTPHISAYYNFRVKALKYVEVAQVMKSANRLIDVSCTVTLLALANTATSQRPGDCSAKSQANCGR